MCHDRLRRFEERAEHTRREGLWDLFYRETEGPAPPVRVAERDEELRPERKEALTGTGRRTND
jgi:hypothetical protein